MSVPGIPTNIHNNQLWKSLASIRGSITCSNIGSSTVNHNEGQLSPIIVNNTLPVALLSTIHGSSCCCTRSRSFILLPWYYHQTQMWTPRSVTFTFLYNVPSITCAAPSYIFCLLRIKSFNAAQIFVHVLFFCHAPLWFSCLIYTGYDVPGNIYMRGSSFRTYSRPFLFFCPDATMSQHMHDVMPGSGGNTFHQDITTGINQEYIKICGSPQIQHHSVDHYLQLTANSSTYATHTEVVAAN